MAVRQITRWHPAPGRAADTIAAFTESKRIQEQLGARARAWSHIADGTLPTTFSYVMETDSLAAHLRVLGKLRVSQEFQSLVQRVLQVPNPPATYGSSVITTEIPGLEAGPLTAAPGTMVASLFLWKPQPGRLPDVIASGKESKAIAAGMGGNMSGWLNTYAGDGAGLVGATFFFESYEALASYQEQAAGNAAWQERLRINQAADAPSVAIRSALLAEIAI